jgi:GNAT superfamily N-acetyltransferase
MDVHVRLIRPDDEAAYRSILERTSEDDRYSRFLQVLDVFDPAAVHRYVDARPDMIGAIALDGKRPLGAAHAALLDDGSAELAIVVAGDARKRGVGRTLLTSLMRELEDRGYMRFVAFSLRENSGFTALARGLGFRCEHADGAAMQWTRDAARWDLVHT